MRDIVFILARVGHWVTCDEKHILVASFHKDVLPENVTELLTEFGYAPNQFRVNAWNRGAFPYKTVEVLAGGGLYE